MRKFRMILGEGTVGYSPVVVQPLDEFAKAPPLGDVGTLLERQEGSRWQPTTVTPVVTPGGMIAYPGLERRANPVGKPAVRYRVQLQPSLYIPSYPPRANGTPSGGLVFVVRPYGRTPPLPPVQPLSVFLFPAPNYPFPTHVPVLRGLVQLADSTPVASAEVTHALIGKALTSGRGEFALPLRWLDLDPAAPVDITLDAEGWVARAGRWVRVSGQLDVRLPDGLRKSQTITVT